MPSEGISPGFPLTSSDITLVRSLGCLAVASQGCKSRLATKPLLVGVGCHFFCDAGQSRGVV